MTKRILEQDTRPLKTRQRVFEDASTRVFTPAVAVVDDDGEHTGTHENPLFTQAPEAVEILGHILTEMRTMNAHLAEITGSEFDEGEHEVNL